MRFLVLLLGTLLLLAAAPVAAHISHPLSTHLLQLGAYEVVVVPTPSPVFENASTTFVMVNVQAEAAPLPPAKIILNDHRASRELNFSEQNGLLETSPLAFNAAGSIHAWVSLENGSQDLGTEFVFDVYRNLSFRFTPIDALEDPLEGRPFQLTFRAVDPTASESMDVLNDLAVTAEPWPTSTNPLRDINPVERRFQASFEKNGTATWTTTVTFSVDGAWRLWLSSESGRFTTRDMPPWQVDVLPGPKEDASGLTVFVTIVAVLFVIFRPRGKSRD